jgi:hypothetical protein
MTATLIHTLLRSVYYAIRYYLTRPSWLSEVASGIATVSWGLLACNIVDAEDRNWPSVDIFFRISETTAWGWLAIMIGVGQIGLCQLVDKGWSRPWMRWAAAIGASWLWGVITWSAVRIEPWPPGAGAYFGWWFVNVYLISRIFWIK